MRTEAINHKFGSVSKALLNNQCVCYDCVVTVTAKVFALIVSEERNVKSVLLILLHFNYS